MGANSSRQYTYQQYYNAAQKSGAIDEIDFTDIDIDSINPYEVLNVSKNFTWNELKEAYRKLAINTHPDKQGGNKDLFNIITICFKKLGDELKRREDDKGHHDLKKQSNDFFHKMTNNEQAHPSEVLSPSDIKMTPTKFNKNFEKCKLYDEEIEFGYGSKMEVSTKVREDISIEKLIKKNNSSSIEKNSSLAYTDYMRAHDGTRLVDPSLMKNVKEFKSVDEYEAYRENKAKKVFSARELKAEELKKDIERIKEEIKNIEEDISNNPE